MKSQLLTTIRSASRRIWTAAGARFERGWQWLMVRWRTALRVISLCASLGLIALCIFYSGSLLKRIISAWSWYVSEVVSKDGTPVYPHTALVNPVVAGIGAVLLIGAALQQAATARRRHKEQTDADRQRRITESYSKAMEQLASDKMEMRLGGIYTLERISNESFDDYWTVMETLCAFVRERAPWPTPKIASSETETEILVKSRQTDIRAALTVIVRRNPKNQQRENEYGWQLDFRQTDLQGAFLYRANLHGANFALANLSKANLMEADLGEAYLWRADLTQAHLSGVNLREATLSEANLSGAALQNADLSEASINDADLSGVDLEHADLSGADLGRTNLSGVDLSEVKGDEGTDLPDGVPRPAHWPASDWDDAT